MKRALFIALKEVNSYLQDKADLAFSLLLPIAVFALMYGAFGSQMTFHGTANIVNNDPGGAYSTQLLDKLAKIDELNVVTLSSADAANKLERSDILLVITIPQDFSRKLNAGQPAELLFQQRGNGGQEGQIVGSLVRGAVSEIDQELQVQSQVQNALDGQNIPAEHIQVTVQKFLDRQQNNPTVVVNEVAIGLKPDLVKEFMAGIITMFVLFSLTLSARSIIEERKKSTLERLLTTRLSINEMFIGKFLASVARGFVQTIILLVLAYVVFRIFTPASFLSALVIALLFAAAASALGMVIATLARTEDSSTWISVFFTMTMVMLGGTFFTIAEGSVWETLSKFSINSYANSGFKEIIINGTSLTNLTYEITVMAGVTVVGLIISRLLFRVIPGGR